MGTNGITNFRNLGLKGADLITSLLRFYIINFTGRDNTSQRFFAVRLVSFYFIAFQGFSNHTVDSAGIKFNKIVNYVHESIIRKRR